MKEEIFSFIDNSIDLAIDLETELCKFPAISPESGGEGELDKCNFLQSWLKAQGIVQLERFDAPDERAKGGVRPSLVATINGKDDPEKGCFWIMSHLDVVPPGEESLWTSDPWKVLCVAGGRRSDGKPLDKRIIGRGVEDNQQGLTSSVLAALAFVKQGLLPSRTVKLLFAADEENGSAYGIDWILKNHPDLFRKNDFVLIPDSGSEDGSSIEIAEKNIIWARFVTKGVQAHGSRPDQGANAHLAGAELVLRLHEGLAEKFPGHDPLFEPDYSTFEPTKKEANVPNINTIPGEDVICYDMRILPCYTLEEVLNEVDSIKSKVEAKYGVSISYNLSQRQKSNPTSPDALLVKLLSKNVEEVYGVKTKAVGIGGGTVAAFLRNAGIDSVVWARIDHTAHQPNEYALLDNILGDARVMALMMMS